MKRASASTAALLAATLGMAGCGSGAHRSASPTSPTTTAPPGGTPTTAPAILTAGAEGDRSAVPWDEVGPGWFLAEWAPTAAAAGADPPGTVLYLVDPLGGRYRIASGGQVPPGRFAAWSGDGKRALFATPTGGPGTAAPQYTLLDLTSAESRPITLPTDPSPVQVDFTKPQGLGLVAAGWYRSSPPSVVPVERFDLKGEQQASFPPEGFPPPTGSVAPEAGPIYFLYTPDGTRILVTSDLALQLVGNDGHPIASIPDPAGAISCRPLSWWAAGEALLSCPTPTGVTLWLQPLNGDPPTQLATEGADSDQAWQLTTGIFASDPRCIGPACTGIGRLSADGTTVASAPVPGRGPEQSVSVVGASQSQLAILGIGDSANRGFLEWLDPDTDTATTLLGGTVNGGSVNAAIAQPPALPASSPGGTAPPPHFATPQAAMAYLVSAWNRDDLPALDSVTNPPARAALAAMHSEAVNLRFDHCTARPTGDYICYFDHDYPAGYTQTTEPGGVGHTQFIVGPAAAPGWYLTVFETCG